MLDSGFRRNDDLKKKRRYLVAVLIEMLDTVSRISLANQSLPSEFVSAERIIYMTTTEGREDLFGANIAGRAGVPVNGVERCRLLPGRSTGQWYDAPDSEA